MALERIILNIIPAGDMPVFHCSQYENGRPVIIDLVSSDDDAFLVGEGVSVELHCRKCDDTIVTMEPDEVDNNTVTFVTSEQLTACPGDNLCELVLYSDTDPVQTLATLNFILHVEPDPIAGGITSESEIYNLTQQIEDITQEVIGNDYYNKTEVDGLISGVESQIPTKTSDLTNDSGFITSSDLTPYAKTADLATVATTGDYNDLLNKPTIPDAQIQSDWGQADNTKVDYIKNKPDIDAMIAAALLAVMPVGTESGSIASFDTEIAAPLVNVSCDIVATGGNGTPDNPNPINGYTEAKITRCGVNLWDETWDNCYWNENANGVKVPNASLFGCNDYITVSEGTNIRFVSPTVTPKWFVLWYDKNKDMLSYTRADGGDILTVPANACYMTFYNSNIAYSSTYNNDISINLPSSDTAYHPYTGNTYAIAVGQTVYGCVLDVTRGKLTVEKVKIILNGTEAWGNYPAYNGVSFVVNNMKSGNFMNGICSHFATLSSHGHGIRFGANNNLIYCEEVYTDISGVTDVDSWKTWLSNNNIDIVYPLDTPFDIDLTPEVISAVVGTNNVYSDTNGDTTVQYKDSIQHYIDTRV